MLKNLIEAELLEARKQRNDKVDILRVVLGDIQLAERGKPLEDEKAIRIIQKIMESNKIVGTPKTLRENEILLELFPTWLEAYDKEEIYEFLRRNVTIREHKNQGQAVGIAMKIFKDAGFRVNGKDVAEVVQALRNEYAGVVEC